MAPSHQADNAAERRFPIRISHLLLLSVCCAAVAAVQNLATEWSAIPADQRWLVQLNHLFRTLGFGAALAGAAAAVSYWRSRASGYRASPGAWLLLWIASLALVLGATDIAAAVLAGDTHPFFVYQYQLGALHTAAAVACVVFGVLLPARLDWKLLLFLPAIPLLVAAGVNFWAARHAWANYAVLDLLMIATYLVEVLLLGYACVRDQREGVRRDWLHWLGVVLFCGIAAHDLAIALLQLLGVLN
ncbi:hypothetical protein Pla123a_36560 [Posidoniimonas polymericola]|uniref:Uncharacterized protein n=1 Tax=Posidoniimonas polymericola TaxID=2528002 RepID=A0A5C5YHZ2_9BACT|nr:hypothetical protein [Posidoniimonas polymericola]TWT73762.1 hypothetical protein Pla123a_36560 [Posidoniimonas polymericola]